MFGTGIDSAEMECKQDSEKINQEENVQQILDKASGASVTD
jgi:hypothetical protein